MRTILSALAAALALSSAEAAPRRAGGTPIPAPAAAAGYTTHTFSAVFNAATVDVAETYAPGFKWYVTNYFGVAPPAFSHASLQPDGASVFLDSSILLASAGKIATPPYLVGAAFGCGAYVVGEIKLDPDLLSRSTNPAWWTMAYEHLVSGAGNPDLAQWTGQATGYDHFIEVDTFEYNRNPRVNFAAYGAALHDWYGVYNSTCTAYCVIDSNYNQGTVTPPKITDYSIWHRVGFLWVPATGASDGYVQFYFDDEPVRAPFAWAQFSPSSSPPPTTPFGVIDSQHLVLIMGQGPIYGRAVDVWQGPGACNITN